MVDTVSGVPDLASDRGFLRATVLSFQRDCNDDQKVKRKRVEPDFVSLK